MRKNRTWIAVASLFAFAAIGSADEFAVGGAKVEIPNPEGFVRIDGKNPAYDKIMRSSIPASNDLLVFFGTPDDLKALEGGSVPEQDRNFNAQAIQASANISASDFKTVQSVTESQLANSVKQFEEEIQKLADKTGKAVGEIANADVSIKMGGMVPLGVLGKGDNWLSFGMKLTIEAEGPDGKGSAEGTVVVAMLHIGAKVVALYGTDMTGSEDALESMKTAVWDWKDAVFAANADAEAPAKSSNLPGSRSKGGFDWSSVWAKAGIGAVIGLVVALVLGLGRRKNLPNRI